jgi:hypothetical protein
LTAAACPSYRTAPDVIVKSWGEELAVAYAPLQAKTHLISAAGAVILETAGPAEVSLPSLLLMDAEHDANPLADLAAQQNLQQAVDGLVTAGLLRRA